MTQSSASALLNWQSFNIAAGAQVNFVQPNSAATALNQIFQSNPSVIAGALNANGHVYLLNQNGILFSGTAQVNVGGLVASSLDLSPAALENGIALASQAFQPAFQPYVDATGKSLPSGPIMISPGAQISSPSGQVILVAPEVTNEGSISTPDGQTIIAAGQRVFMLASTDPNVRGLLVEVGDGGTATNGDPANAAAQVGSIAADRGNVTIAGALVQQYGTISATTSVRANGSIYLQARDTSDTVLPNAFSLPAERGGTLILGPASETLAGLDLTDTSTTVDANAQPKSIVSLSGNSVDIEGSVLATSGEIAVNVGAVGPGTIEAPTPSGTSDGSVLTVGSGARLDVSGATAILPVTDNIVQVQLRGSELANSPLQRNGPLRGLTVSVDIRQYGTLDGTEWQGTPLADLSADIAAIPHGLQQRNLTGGTIALQSQGTLAVSSGATLDVAGGQIDWQGGYVNTTNLLGTNGQVYNIAQASPDILYSGIATNQSTTDQRWGVTQNAPTQTASSGQYEAGYVQGADAGTLSISAPSIQLNSQIIGTTIIGPYQRRSPATAAAEGGPTFDIVPTGATLIVGLESPIGTIPDYVVSAVEIAPAGVTAPESSSTLLLHPSLFGLDAVSNLLVYANQSISLDAGVTLDLPSGSEFALTANRIAVAGSVYVPGGTIQLNGQVSVATTTTPSLEVESGAVLSTAGNWVNDTPTGSPDGVLAPIFINGGTVSLSVDQGSLKVDAGSLIDVSGGAQLTAADAVVAGKGGSLSIGTTVTTAPTPVTLEGELRGFGLNNGGKLSITANSICISETTCAMSLTDPITLSPAWFLSNGFSSIALATNFGSIEVATGTEVALQQRNFVFNADPSDVANGTAFETLVTEAQLPAFEREPMNLSLSARPASRGFTVVDLALDEGSALVADPLATVSLQSAGDLFINGTISAPGGTISATLASVGRPTFNPSLGIWVGPDAVLDVSGTAVFQPTDAAPLAGNVLPGGSISLVADRGYLFTDPGSSLDVSGTAALVDVKLPSGAYALQPVGSAAGSMTFAAAEGMQLDAGLQGAAGLAGLPGGTLTVNFDATARAGDASTGYPTGDRTVVVGAAASPVVVAEGIAVPANLNGVARIAAPDVASAGFDAVTLSANNVYTVDVDTGASNFAGRGIVAFEAGATLAVPTALNVNASTIEVLGSGSATLRSAYVSLGSTVQANQVVTNSTGGGGILDVVANDIDVVGNVSLQNIGQFTLNSTGDVRLIGVASTTGLDYTGTLSTLGNVSITAQQIYPTTLSEYSIVAGTANGEISLFTAPGQAGSVLSAGGQLTLQANLISDGGVLRAPFGTLTLDASTIDVLGGAVISTSGAGQDIFLGQTQGGIEWTFPEGGAGTLIYGPAGLPLPSQQVVLNGVSVNVAKGSTIDIAGGGDLLAWEFVSGPTGTVDVLAPGAVPNQYAILPSANLAYAPYDPELSTGFGLAAGQQIYLSSGSGVPAGYYTLLPARYALLPGAYLVTEVSGDQNLPAGATLSVTGGGTIVSGRLAFANGAITAPQTNGWEVQPGSAAQNYADYTVTSANAFFPQQATQTGTTLNSALPIDAGVVSLFASSVLTLEGTFDAGPGSGGRGATLELSSTNLLVGPAGASVAPGTVLVSAGELSGIGAQTLIIGGEEQLGTTGPSLVVGASTVAVAPNTQISAPEVVLAAQDSLSLGAGSSVSASGSVTGTYSSTLGLDATSSVLIASAGPLIQVTRGTSGGGQGLVNFAAGSTISSSDSIVLDVGIQAVTQSTFSAQGALSLAAPQVALGAASAGYAGVVFDPGSSAVTAPTLVLSGRTAIDVFSGASYSGTDLILQTPLIRAADPEAVTNLSATQMQLSGTATAYTGPLSTGGGILNLSAQEIDASGNLAFSGFSSVGLNAMGVLRASGAGNLSTTGDLALSAGWITADGGSNYSIAAAGALTLQALGATAAAEPGGNLGAGLSLTGASISGAARISAPSGVVALEATTGDLMLGAATVIDASGSTVTFDNVVEGAPGGQVTLTADQGSIQVGSGALIDVSVSGAAAQAGAVTLTAPQGAVDFAATVRGAAPATADGGSVTVAAQSFNLPQLMSAFATGGFTGNWNLWLEGPGNLTVPSAVDLRISSLLLTADAGGIDIAGIIDSSASSGGSVTLNASGPIAITGAIEARATNPGQLGGQIALASGSSVLLAASGSLDVSGTTSPDPAIPVGGSVAIRLPQSAVESVVGASPATADLQLSGTISGARTVTIEGYQTYLLSDGIIGDAQVAANVSNPWYAAAASFASQGTAILAALGLANQSAYSVVPGIEVDSPGDLHLAANWNLYDWHFNGVPGVLTLRAAGNLDVDNSLSDGFASIDTGPSSFLLPSTPSSSWSYRLTAGAALDSANPLATSPTALAAGTGSLVIAPGVSFTAALVPAPTLIRTGTGYIDIATASDVVFGNQASVIYTAGVAGPGILNRTSLGFGGLGGLAYPYEGGDISIQAGRDIIGPNSQELVSDWLFRGGGVEEFQGSGTAWTVDFGQFESGVGALGGGNVTIAAGRDIVGLSAATPSIGREVGGSTPSTSVVQVVGGGNLMVSAGRDILGGVYYEDNGVGTVSAGGEIAASSEDITTGNTGAAAIAPMFALGAGTLQVTARGDVNVSTIFNPTLIDVSTTVNTGAPSYWANYTPTSAADVVSVAGAVNLMTPIPELDYTTAINAISAAFPNYPAADTSLSALQVLPPSLNAVALSGNLSVGASMFLWPAPYGNLNLFAAKNVNLNPIQGGDTLFIVMSDAPLSALPTVTSPQGTLEAVADLLSSSIPQTSQFNAPVPVHESGAQGVDTTPARIVALQGDVAMDDRTPGSFGQIYIPKTLDIFAGEDVSNVNVEMQNLLPTDVSSITAGRDLIYPELYNSVGGFIESPASIVVDGPGTLDVTAGRNVDLGTSQGIVSQGNLRNPALPVGGANISILAGVSGQPPDYSGFISTYLAGSTLYDSELIDYVQGETGQTGLSKETALADFEQYSSDIQRGLLEQILFAELRAGGRSAAAAGPGHDNYSRAFDALVALFPGANPSSGASNPYSGNIELYFSRVYTLQGGTINLLAPGGGINVGLATPPTAFDLTKQPSQLGIVAQSTGDVNALSFGDFEVNASRVFAADGGNILIWSTDGNIDAGRGAKTAISAPAPEITVSASGQVQEVFPPALTGSGIQTLATTSGVQPGDVDLYAPQGVVNANDAGIVAGNLTIGATAVLGANNISVSGIAVGVPVSTAGLGASLTGATGVASGATNQVSSVGDAVSDRAREQSSSVADTMISFLDVFVLGFGEEQCKSDDLECLKRQKK